MKIYSLKSCDICRNAIKLLKSGGLNPVIRDVRSDGLTNDELTRFYNAFGDKLLNRRSTTWRNLSDAERILNPIELLAANPTLMKRPVIETEGQLFLGWDSDVRKALLG